MTEMDFPAEAVRKWERAGMVRCVYELTPMGEEVIRRACMTVRQRYCDDAREVMECYL